MPLPSIMFSQDAVMMCTCAHMLSELEVKYPLDTPGKWFSYSKQARSNACYVHR